MSKSITLQLLSAAHLTIDSAEIVEINPIIFKTKVLNNLAGLTVSDGVHYKVDTVKNTAIEVTASAISTNAKSALENKKDADGSLAIAESFGLIQSLKLVHDAKGDSTACVDLLSVARNLGMKITDVEVAEQNDIIFRTTGIKMLGNLTEDDKKYYVLDTAKNTATLINPQAIAERAAKDFLKGKSSDFTALASRYKLVTSVTLQKSSGDEA